MCIKGGILILVNNLANQLPKDKPDNRIANARQSLGGQFGEMRIMTQYLFENFTFQGKAMPYQDLTENVALGDMSCRLMSTPINCSWKVRLGTLSKSK